jgi:hypothetical protein
MLLHNELPNRDTRGGILTEEKFLRYRLQVVQKMVDGPLKAAIVTAIVTRSKALQQILGEGVTR